MRKDKIQAGISCQQARELDMIAYLHSLGYTPARVRGSDYWYLSPLRAEHTPSFKINSRLNRWYDHGLGKGGNLLDFALLYLGCSLSECLQQLAAGAHPRQPTRLSAVYPDQGQGKIAILAQQPLSWFPLRQYLRSRGISPALAMRYCRQVTYRLYGRVYRAIGFANNAGGFELRTPWFKAGSSPKDITTIGEGTDEVVVLEGFVDFLSYLQLFPQPAEPACDFVVLNSVSHFEKARPWMERHATIHLYLDQDPAGRSCTQRALSLSDRYRDASSLYAQVPGVKDLNDWLLHQQPAPFFQQRNSLADRVWCRAK